MIRGLYSAATGMLAGQYAQDVIAGNLANSNTIGYKQDSASFKALQQMALSRFESGDDGVPVGSVGLGVQLDGATTSFAEGSLAATGSPLDVALQGTGFFAIQTPQGERYTRDGHFHLQPTGKGPNGKPTSALVDDNGNAVLGLKGPIKVGDAKQISIGENGAVVVDGTTVDRLKVVTGPDSAFTKQGANLFSATGATTPSKALVKSGYLEQSNVSPITGMVKMIAVQRAYEAAQRAVTAQDDSLNKAVNELGKV